MKKIVSLIILLFSITTLLCAQCMSLEMQLKHIIKDTRATIGIAIIIDGKDTVTVNNNIRYPLMSVVKFHQALALADYLERKKQPLETMLLIKKADLKKDTYSPLRDKYPQGEFEISIANLLKYTLQQSDNNACDILFQYQGGTEAVNDYIHLLGVSDCNISVTESSMHQDLNRCYQNWSSPLAAVKLLDIFLRKPLFSNEYKEFILSRINERLTNDFFDITLVGSEGLAVSGRGNNAWNAYVASLNIMNAKILFSKSNLFVSKLFEPGTDGNRKSLEKHHLFPKAYLKSLNCTDAKINQMANYALIDWKDNMDILDDAPSVYYPIICAGMSDEQIRVMEEENALPHGWENMSYDDFLIERRKLMAAKIKIAFEVLKKAVTE